MAYSTIDKATLYANTITYSGTGADTNAITGVGFQPDFVWIKEKSSTSNHALYDVLRGTTKKLESDGSGPEQTEATTFASFDSDGFTVNNNAQVNESGQTYVSWNWKMGTTSGLSGGTITPSAYSINTTAKQGIYKYTGTGSAATIAHGLGVVPTLIIVKDLGATENWQIYHQSTGATKYFTFTNNAESAQTSRWNDTAPTSTLFTVGTDSSVNSSGNTYIAYVFSDVKGYSKMSTYKGTGQNTQGQFIYTGFKPSFVLIKNWAGSEDWHLYDNKREYSFNLANKTLDPNQTSAEYTISDGLDFYSNGFRTWTSGSALNTSGQEYIYAAFGQTMVGTNGVAGTAR